MKATKLIREYVENEVAKAYESRKNPHKEQAERDKVLISAFRKELKEQQAHMMEKFIVKYGIVGSRSGLPIPTSDVGTSTPSLYDWATEDMFLAEKWEQQNQRDRARKTREILVNLELGATKTELQEMMQKMLEEIYES